MCGVLIPCLITTGVVGISQPQNWSIVLFDTKWALAVIQVSGGSHSYNALKQNARLAGCSSFLFKISRLLQKPGRNSTGMVGGASDYVTDRYSARKKTLRSSNSASIHCNTSFLDWRTMTPRARQIFDGYLLALPSCERPTLSSRLQWIPRAAERRRIAEVDVV